jgi:hypothetical protein
MRKRVAFLIVEACLVLAAIAWLAAHSTKPAHAPLELAAPPAEKLAALDSAETTSPPAIEAQAGPAREALEVRTIQTRAATITVQPPKVAGERQGMIIVWCYLEGSHANVTPEEIALVGPDGRELSQRPAKDGDSFRDLASGLYSVLVRDPRFESVRIDSVATGSHVLVELVGTVRIRPHATDAETGEALETSTLRLLGFGREKAVPPDAEGWFTGLPCGDLELHVSAPGYEQAQLVAVGLSPGESREVELRFSRAGEIHGIVVGEADGQPVAHVLVTLESPSAREFLRGRMEDFGELSSVQIVGSGPARSDMDGRFEIKNLRLGEYSVQARQGGNLESPAQTVKLGTGSRIQEVVLRVPPACSLAGTLTCKSAGDSPVKLGELFVAIHTPGDPGGRSGSTASTDVRADGSFMLVNSLPIGRAEVRLRFGSVSLARVLGELDLHAGLNECSFDISELLPGNAVVEIVAQGIEIDGGQLLVAPREGGTQVEKFEFNGNSGVVGPLPPGDYLVLARGSPQTWMCTTPIPLRIESSTSARARLEFRLVPGRLVVRDSKGEALGPGAFATLSRSAPRWPDGQATIRPELAEGGELALALEPGPFALTSVSVRRGTAIFESGPAFEWTAAGPTPAVLRLPPTYLPAK